MHVRRRTPSSLCGPVLSTTPSLRYDDVTGSLRVWYVVAGKCLSLSIEFHHSLARRDPAGLRPAPLTASLPHTPCSATFHNCSSVASRRPRFCPEIALGDRALSATVQQLTFSESLPNETQSSITSLSQGSELFSPLCVSFLQPLSAS